MRVAPARRQRGVELPLAVSDHADWPELIATIVDTGAPKCWITHGARGGAGALRHPIAACAPGPLALSAMRTRATEGVERFAELLDRLLYTRSATPNCR